jgi:uncharacterized membrane protein HdeD (DUF308 family)
MNIDDATVTLVRSWWIVALRGLAAIAAGVVTLAWPGMSLGVLFTIVGLYFFADGMLVLTMLFRGARDRRGWWPYLVEGMLSVCVGFLAFVHPAALKLALLALVAARLLLTGGVEIAAAISVRRAGDEPPWLLWLGGAASAALGIYLLARPHVALRLLVTAAALYAILFGATLAAAGLRLWRAGRRTRAGSLV